MKTTQVEKPTSSIAATVTEEDLRSRTIYQSPYMTIEHPSDARTLDQMNAVECSGTLEFWSDAEEDVY